MAYHELSSRSVLTYSKITSLIRKLMETVVLLSSLFLLGGEQDILGIFRELLEFIAQAPEPKYYWNTIIRRA